MLDTLQRLTGSSTSVRRRVVVTYVGLGAFNIVAWALTLLAARDYPILLPSAILAYSFGLRHAVDADHIAAIDNTTRKLMQEGQRPVGVGLFFSLGHSTVVVAISVLLAITAGVVSEIPPSRRSAGSSGRPCRRVFLLAGGRDQPDRAARHLPHVPAASRRAARTTSRTWTSTSRTAACSRGCSGRRCKHDPQELAHVPAGRAVRPRLRHGQRGGPAGPGGHVRRQRTCPWC